jgi:cyanophycinase-like exopeptidase
MSGRPRPVHLFAGSPQGRSRGADPVLVAALAETGRPLPSVAYVGVASGDDRDFFRFVTAYLRRSGAGEVRLAALASARADVAEARAVIERSDLTFVSGGDVEAGMAHLERHGLIPLLRALHGAGTPFVGLSAGSIMLARCWVRWSDPDDDATASVFPCLGLARVLCDCHAESDDWEELRALLALTGDGVGYGIPAGGALRVDANGAVAALGKPAPRFECRDGRVAKRTDLTPA